MRGSTSSSPSGCAGGIGRATIRSWAGPKAATAKGAVLAVPAAHKEGRQISIEFTILPVRDGTGSLVGIAAFLRDATARFEEMRALRREIAALKGGG